MNKIFKKKLNKKGFTLIELIVVIAILGILALIAIPRFTGMQKRAKEQSIISTATAILNAAEIAYVEENAPATGAGTKGDIGGLVEKGYLRSADYTGFTLSTGTNDGEYTVSYSIGDIIGAVPNSGADGSGGSSGD